MHRSDMVANHFRPIDSHGICLDHPRLVANDFGGHCGESSIDLDRHNISTGLDQRQRERSQAGPDLDDQITRADEREGGNPSNRVRIGHKVLTQLSTGREPIPIE